MPARRCAIGCESWPDNKDFKTCLVCGEDTRRISNATPTMSDEDAQTVLKTARFEAWLLEHGRE